jgi:hypothetical protein
VPGSGVVPDVLPAAVAVAVNDGSQGDNLKSLRSPQVKSTTKAPIQPVLQALVLEAVAA